MTRRLVALALLGAILTAANDGGDADTTPSAVPALEPILRPPPRNEIGPVVTSPATAKPAPAPSNPGPVTGYGTGGMQQQLGSPPNPSYLAAPYTVTPMPR